MVSAELGSSWFEKLIVAGLPSSTGPLLPRSAVGATFCTEIGCVSVLPADAPKPESVAWAETDVLAGPSANLQSKLPDVFVLEALDFVPLPQLVATEAIVSPSGSLIE